MVDTRKSFLYYMYIQSERDTDKRESFRVYPKEIGMATIKDVAQRAQVAPSTISKYMNGGNVRPEHAEAIREAIAELGYRVLCARAQDAAPPLYRHPHAGYDRAVLRHSPVGVR